MRRLTRSSRRTASLVVLAVASLAGARFAPAAAPTPEQALALTPIQKKIRYDRPTAEQVDRCTVRPEKNAGSTAWVVRDETGKVLRRFADTNRDNVVDVWSYYRDGLEVYRDLDTNYDNNADQYRWFNTAGSRWAIDRDQDGRIDTWRSISPHEVAEEAVSALLAKDRRAFQALLISPDELAKLGASGALGSQLAESLAKASAGFRKLVAGKERLSASAEFTDFSSSRPSTIPADGAKGARDVDVCPNAMALVGVGDKSQQVQLGTLVRVGDAWRMVEAPQIGNEAVGMSVTATFAASSQAADNPTEEMQRLMGDLERLDQQPRGKTAKAREQAFLQRAKLLQKLTTATPAGAIRDQWFGQLADMFSAAVIDGEQPAAGGMLAKLDTQARKAGAGVDARAHIRFQRVYTDWVVKSQNPQVDYARLQEDWRTTLRAFAKDFPESPDTAEALLQLGMVDDLAGRDEDAKKWYARLARDFDGTPRGEKAKGALRRLGSPGKAISLRGAGLMGGRLDLAQYRGKVVVVQYWATWCEPCKEDMQTLSSLVSKYGGKGFAVVGVNVDTELAEAQQFVKQNRLPWRHLGEPGGLEGRLANEMGVINLPLLLLVDKSGKVISRNVRADEVEAELQKLLR